MIRVCPLSALPGGEALRVEAEPPIAVFHTEEGEVFAIDDTCTHQDASLADGWVEGCEVEYDVWIQFAGHAADADSVTVEEGSAESRDLLAVYRRGDEPVAVLGMNQARPFTRWRRQLNAAPVPA